MKIIVDKDIPFIEGRITGEEVVYLPGNKISREFVKDADALIIRTRTICNARLLERTSVKLIATATIGTDHIDLPWCAENGILVESAPGCNAPGVAQYVFASLFLNGFNPRKDVLGIIGYGNVGSTVGKWASQMGVPIMVNDPYREERGMADIDYRNLKEVLSNSDAVTLHVPLSTQGSYPTYHLIGKAELEGMRKNAILVNTSRGGVVDETALKNFIKSGKRRAIIDVWEKEPVIDKELLMLAETATPHIAGYSYEGKKRGTMMALKALEKHLGISINTEGLEVDSNAGRTAVITPQIISSSYDPCIDSDALKRNPGSFEELRNNYDYRHEPLASAKIPYVQETEYPKNISNND